MRRPQTQRSSQRWVKVPPPESAPGWGPPAVATYLAGKVPNADRLFDVAVETGGDEPLAVSLHRERRERDDRDRGGPGVVLELADRHRPVHVRQANVHQDHVRQLLDGERYRCAAGRRLKRPEACMAQYVARELQVLLVVVDHERHLASRAGHTGGSTGIVKRKALPSPGTLSAHSRPPCSSTKRRESGRPRPVPSSPAGEVPRAWRNSSKIRSESAAGMPAPVSVTSTSTTPSVSRAETSTRPPVGVNLTALDSKLKITWRSLRSSARIVISAGWSVRSSATPARRARSACMVRPASSAWRNENSERASSIFPASILERSRMSLMSDSRCLPDSSTSST